MINTKTYINFKLRLWLPILLLCPTVLLSQPASLVDRYTHYTLDLSNGLPHNFVDDIFQDSYGFTWICSNGGGLTRYDGFGCTSFAVNATHVTLRSNSCRNAAEDRHHRLWVAYEEGVSVLDLTTMNAVTPPCDGHPLQERLARLCRRPTLRVFVDSQGNVWLAGDTELTRLRINGAGRIDAISSVRRPVGGPDLAILDDRHDGQPLVGTNSAVQRVTIHGTQLRLGASGYRLPDISGRYVLALLRHQGQLWIGTSNGLYTTDPSHPQPFLHTADATSLAHNYVSSLAVSHQGRLLVGTLCGVDLYEPHTQAFAHWSAASAVAPLSSNFVNCLLVSHGQIWVGTETGGVNRLVPRLLNVTNYRHAPQDATSLAPNAVNAMYCAADGTLYIGNVEGGLSIKVPGSNTFTHLTTANSALRHNSVSVLASDNRGRLWVGTWGGGVSVLPKGGQLTALTVPSRYEWSMTFIGAMAYDAINDGMWIGTNSGLFFYDQRHHRLTEPFPGSRDIRGCIGAIVTRRGELFMGYLGGMVEVPLRQRRKDGTFRPVYYHHKLDDPQSGINEKISCFLEASDGTLWLGSNSYGLYRMTVDAAGHRTFKTYTAKDGLSNNSVKGITEDGQHHLWIATVNGLSELNPRTGVFTNYSEQDGLVSSQFYWNGATTDHHGTLYFGSEHGLVAVHSVNNVRFYGGQLRLTQLLVDNQVALAGSRYLQEDIALARRIRLHESDNSVTLEFSALNYGGETQGTYVYRLRGLEDDWITLPAGEHSVRYSRLPSGHYTFEVRYLSNFTQGEPQHLAVEVDVAPYFYKSWWFQLLILIAVAASATWAYRRRMTLLRNQEAERLYRPIEAALKESGEPGRLQTRIQEILNNQKYYRESQRKSLQADVEETQRTRHPFMPRVMQVLEEHYADSAFGVAELCQALGMSKSTVSRKLSEEVGQTTAAFLRDYRLDVAHRLMTENPADRNITEIAYRVGFNDPKYFARCFKTRYGVAPSATQ